MTDVERPIIAAFQEFIQRMPIFSPAIFFIAEILPYVLLAGIAVFFAWRAHDGGQRRLVAVYGIVGCVAAIISRFGITVFIRMLVDRPRPFEVLSFQPLFSHDIGHAFPSGHAAFFFAFLPFVFVRSKQAGIIYAIGIFFMGLARVAAGVHWPTDIVAGAVVGIVSGYTLLRVLQRFSRMSTTQKTHLQ